MDTLKQKNFLKLLDFTPAEIGALLDLAAKLYLCAAELGALLLPVHYAVTPHGNYSDGIHANVSCSKTDERHQWSR